MKKAISKNGLILAGFALICSGLVAGVYSLTKDTIKAQELLQKTKVLQEVIPTRYHDNQLNQFCIKVSDEHRLGSDQALNAYIATLAGEPSAIAIETIAPDGYNGNIQILVGLTKAGEILGVRTISHQETPGLGDKIELRKADWVLSFDGFTLANEKDPRLAVKKDGGQFDQFTGATITPRAYTKAVKNAIVYVTKHPELFNQSPNCEN
ncbi:electron transport complex subunit RsxG [Paraferrimonas sp. SM1919]|uniref:electron transport complex subunit RsxG n=1 Tax=Paraferrimonas sp. SM1919 TaxID=2662263 RepID=UPI001969DCB8|nr:electron transport complex subunit RsxG [Paraferrimonas sp. SM1919]